MRLLRGCLIEVLLLHKLLRVLGRRLDVSARCLQYVLLLLVLSRGDLDLLLLLMLLLLGLLASL